MLAGAPDSSVEDTDLAGAAAAFFPCHLICRLQRPRVTDETLLRNIFGFMFRFITTSPEPCSMQGATHIYS